jgi:hypothetical protein
VVHDRRIGERELTLGVSGKLVDGNLVMYDRETETLFLQRTGESMDEAGVALGERLEERPREEWRLAPWAEWRREHPDTLVLSCAHCEGRGPATGTIDEPAPDASGTP